MSKKLTIEEMRRIAKSRGGLCLSKIYVNQKTKITWQCRKGHVWEATPTSVKNNRTWCQRCAKKAMLTIEEMQELAKKRGGLCLSDKYVNNKSKLKWQCNEEHVWESKAENVKNGSWCPICSTGISERICRSFFEALFNEKFPKKKPAWLVGPRGNRLELDGYCKKLCVAFEYQGIQHYKTRGIFNNISLDWQKAFDKSKIELCEKHNIVLIVVPYTVKYEEMENYIRQECAKQKIQIPNNQKTNYTSFDIYSKEGLKEMQEIAKERGGNCLSKKYVNCETKFEFQCKKGHRWSARPMDIKHRKSWCPACSNNVRLTIEQMQELAKERGGLCLSEKYVDSKTKLKWQCEKGDIWDATPNQIRRGHWCPVCARNRK